MKNRGGNFDSKCLEIACRLKKNSKVIKFLILECNVAVTYECIKNFENAYFTEGISLLIEHFSNNNNNNNNGIINDDIQLNEKCLLTIQPKNVNSLLDYNKEIKLKKKIVCFFNIKSNYIIYKDLYKIFLQYLIDNKLVIANYFIVNTELSQLFKINNYIILNINQIHNILTYFIF